MLAPPENVQIEINNSLPIVDCETTRIKQIFQNLLSNAIKFIDKPQGQIIIGCTEENSYWQLSIADNDPGIEEKYFHKIFQIFQKLSNDEGSDSTGIGLSLVKKIVEMYGREIWV